MVLPYTCPQSFFFFIFTAVQSLNNNNRELEPWTVTGSEHFARQDSGLSQIFKLIVSTSKKRLKDINVVV